MLFPIITKMTIATEAVDKSLSLYHYHCKVTESLGKLQKGFRGLERGV